MVCMGVCFCVHVYNLLITKRFPVCLLVSHLLCICVWVCSNSKYLLSGTHIAYGRKTLLAYFSPLRCPHYPHMLTAVPCDVTVLMMSDLFFHRHPQLPFPTPPSSRYILSGPMLSQSGSEKLRQPANSHQSQVNDLLQSTEIQTGVCMSVCLDQVPLEYKSWALQLFSYMTGIPTFVLIQH